MQYYVICKLDGPFLTKWLLFPYWEHTGGDIVCIIDKINNKYIMHSDWKNENDEPNWQDIEEDHL